MVMPVIKSTGTLSDVPKTIVRNGKRYEQSVGAHTLAEIKKFKTRYDLIYPGYVHMIVKSLTENKPHWTHMGTQTFYWIYERRVA